MNGLMGQAVGGSLGQMAYAQQTQAATLLPSEAVSRDWAAAWERLQHAKLTLEKATLEAAEARDWEQTAWNALEIASGRGPQCAKAADPRRY